MAAMPFSSGAEAAARGLLVAACVVAWLAGACRSVTTPDAPPDCATAPAPAGSVPPTGPSNSPARPWRTTPPIVGVWAVPPLQVDTDVPLPGDTLRFDYQSIDTGMNRLYISHMGDGNMVVFDLQADRVVATVGNLPTVTGVLAVPELGKVYASATGLHQVAIVNDTTLQIVAQVGRIGFPDGLAYAPDEQKVYVSDESGGGELVIDGRSNQVVTTIPLGGQAGNTVYDAGSRCILVAVQTQDQLVAIDPRTDHVIGRYNPAGARHPHGLLVDAPRRLLFVANQGTAVLSVIDLQTMRVLGTEPIGSVPDVLAFDPAWQRLYVGSESGVVSVFTELGASLQLDGEVTMPHAHTVAADPRTHLVYFPLQDLAGQPVLRIMSGTPPPPAGAWQGEMGLRASAAIPRGMGARKAFASP